MPVRVTLSGWPALLLLCLAGAPAARAGTDRIAVTYDEKNQRILISITADRGQVAWADVLEAISD